MHHMLRAVTYLHDWRISQLTYIHVGHLYLDPWPSLGYSTVVMGMEDGTINPMTGLDEVK